MIVAACVCVASIGNRVCMATKKCICVYLIFFHVFLLFQRCLAVPFFPLSLVVDFASAALLALEEITSTGKLKVDTEYFSVYSDDFV